MTIGGVTVPIVESMDTQIRRRNTVVDIPFGRQVGYPAGVELEAYTIQTVLWGNTVSEAKSLRRALKGMFSQLDQVPVYIGFTVDSNEFSGWFLLDDIRFSQAGFDITTFPCSMSVRRVSGNQASLIPAIYWEANELTPNSGAAAQSWISYPNGHGNSSLQTYTGNGSTTIVEFSPSDNPKLLYDLDGDTAALNACRVYDTMTGASFGSQVTWLETITEFQPAAEANWEQVSGGYTFAGDVVIDNGGLFRVIWVKSAKLLFFASYNPGGGATPWVYGMHQYLIHGTLGSAFEFPTAPIITSVSDDQIKFSIYAAVSSDNSVKTRLDYTVRRGSYFADMVYQSNSGVTVAGLITLDGSTSDTSGTGYEGARYTDPGGRGDYDAGVFWYHTATASGLTGFVGYQLKSVTPSFPSGGDRVIGLYTRKNGLNPSLATMRRNWLARMAQQIVWVQV